jgi:hypothetical protein
MRLGLHQNTHKKERCNKKKGDAQGTRDKGRGRGGGGGGGERERGKKKERMVENNTLFVCSLCIEYLFVGNKKADMGQSPKGESKGEEEEDGTMDVVGTRKEKKRKQGAKKSCFHYRHILPSSPSS